MAAGVAHCRARVEAVRTPAPEIIEADLRMLEPPEFHWDAGQWVSVPLGPRNVRAYTVVSPPSSSRRVITLCADVSPGGLGSRWFRGLKTGDPVEFEGPMGGFVFSRADPRRPLFVAEEIGIVPVRSILLELYQTGFGRSAILIYCVRDPSRLVYDGEFRGLSRRYPAFTYIPIVREGNQAWKGERGEASELVDRAVPTKGGGPQAGGEMVPGLVAYVSGGGEMIKRVREILIAKGLDRKSVKWEKFW